MVADAEKKTILIADDSEAHRTLMKSMLESERFELVLKEDGKEVLEFLKTNEPDLLILDVNMPFIDGLSIVERVRWVPRLKEMPVIIVTAMTDEDTQKNAAWVKPSAMLDKAGLTKAHLVANVTRLLQGQTAALSSAEV